MKPKRRHNNNWISVTIPLLIILVLTVCAKPTLILSKKLIQTKVFPHSVQRQILSWQSNLFCLTAEIFLWLLLSRSTSHIKWIVFPDVFINLFFTVVLRLLLQPKEITLVMKDSVRCWISSGSCKIRSLSYPVSTAGCGFFWGWGLQSHP